MRQFEFELISKTSELDDSLYNDACLLILVMIGFILMWTVILYTFQIYYKELLIM